MVRYFGLHLILLTTIAFNILLSSAQAQNQKDYTIVHSGRIKTHLYKNKESDSEYLQLILDDKLLTEVSSSVRWPLALISNNMARTAMMGKNYKIKNNIHNIYQCTDANRNDSTYKCSLIDNKILEMVDEEPTVNDHIILVEDFSSVKIESTEADSSDSKNKKEDGHSDEGDEVQKVCQRLKTENVSADTLSLFNQILTLAKKSINQ